MHWHFQDGLYCCSLRSQRAGEAVRALLPLFALRALRWRALVQASALVCRFAQRTVRPSADAIVRTPYQREPEQGEHPRLAECLVVEEPRTVVQVVQ